MNHISVIIPTKNRHNDLKITIDKICRGTVLPHELIIVDQSTTAFEIDLRNFMETLNSTIKLKYYHLPEISGPIAARDYGFKQSTGELILFLDDDISIFPDFMANLMATYTRYPWIDAICAVNVMDRKLSLITVALRCIFWIGPFWDNKIFIERFAHLLRRPVRSRMFSAGYMSCKRKVFEDIGLDQSLTGHVFAGDMDFGFKASKLYGLYISPELRVIHREATPLYNAEKGVKNRVHARRFIYNRHVKKSTLNRLAFTWLMIGTFLDSLIRSIRNLSMQPLKGYFQGFREDINK